MLRQRRYGTIEKAARALRVGKTTSTELAERELAEGTDRGPLHGIQLGVKDLIAVADGPTTARSRVLDGGRSAGTEAAVVARLKAAEVRR